MISTLGAVTMTESPTVAPAPMPGSRPPRSRSAATVLGVLAALLAVAFPFLPVEQVTARLSWPTVAGGTAPVTAPLVALRPLLFTADVGCAALHDLAARSAVPAVVVSTTPPGVPGTAAVGLAVALANGVLTIDDRGARLAEARLGALRPGAACGLAISSTPSRTQVVLGGRVLVSIDGDHRPQVVGIYSDLDGSRDDLAGTAVRIDVDNRFDSSPTILKTLTGIGAVAALLGCLWVLRREDARHGRRPMRPRGRGDRRGSGRGLIRDGSVVAILVVWAVVGGMTPDDGYILTMVRAARSAGWIGNYYRWFDVPESPFGWFYELYAGWAAIDHGVLWLRLPALATGIVSWWLISRQLLPRLGVGVRLQPGAVWAAAALFLCFWLPFCNGLRPEPVVVLGALLSACAVERALAIRRLLPLACGFVAAAFAVAATPTGLLAAAPFLAGARPLVRMLRGRARVAGWAATLAPLVGAGAVVLIAIFADQTWATVAEATRVHTAIGPNLPWSGELYRYTLLFSSGPDGSLARRFPVLILAVCTVTAAAVLLRRGRVPGLRTGPIWRLVGTTVVGFGVLVLTPTKWTHHFGAFAGVGAGLAAVAAVAMGATVLRSRRNRLLVCSVLLAVSAFAFTAPNSWWYVSNWGVPWFDRPPVVGGVSVSSVLLGGAVVLLGFAASDHLRGAGCRPAGHRVRVRPPLAVICWLVVLFEVVSLVKGVQKQAGSYSLGADTLADPAGTGCGLSAHVLVETDPAAGRLLPVPGPPPVLDGFSVGGLPPDGPGSPRDVDGAGGTDPTVTAPGPAIGPVLGSYRPGGGATGGLQTSWYALPGAAALRAAPLVIGVAGQVGGDTSVTVELGASTPGGVQVLDRLDAAAGTAVSATADPTGTGAGGRGWRDLRFDLPRLGVPAGVDRVRVLAQDRALPVDGWVAVTPPRVPHLTPLLDVVGSTPGYLDWPVAFPNPCLRPFGITDGIAEMPRFRLLADPQQRGVGQDWSAPGAGGPLAWITVAARQRVVATYLEGDWGRDWGQLRLIEPYTPAAGRPDLETGHTLLWGWNGPGPIGDPPAGPVNQSR